MVIAASMIVALAPTLAGCANTVRIPAHQLPILLRDYPGKNASPPVVETVSGSAETVDGKIAFTSVF